MENNSVKNLLTIAVLVSVIILLVIFLVLPMMARVRDTRTKILANQETVAAQLTQINEFRAAESNLVQIRGSLEEVLGLFPVREDSVVLVETLESAISRSQIAGVKIKLTDAKESELARGGGPGAAATEPARTANLKNLEEVPFTMSVSGTYRNLTDLLFYSENARFNIQINDLNFKAELTQLEDGGTVNTGIANGIFKGTLFMKLP